MADVSSIDYTRAFWGKELSRRALGYPSEFVVRFLAAGPRDERPREGADIGFGSGHHLGLLMEFGYRAHGIDLLPEAVQRARNLYQQWPLLGNLEVGDLCDLPWAEGSLDSVICYGVIFLKPIPAIKLDLARLYALLKPGGRLLLNFRTPANSIAGQGEDLGEGHYILDERAGGYAGSAYTFIDESTSRSLLKEAGFVIENFERWDWWKNNMSECHSWWIVWAGKPEAAK
ncbi:hypothetical protein BH09VER1_BH09VER1_18780 [soil metagenome]